jgi:hypothetical protein
MLLPILALLSAPALAGSFGLSGGLETCYDDPFLNSRGLRTGLAWGLSETVALEGTAAVYPQLGAADWKPLTSQLVNNNHVSPDLSPITMQAHGRVHVYAVRSQFGSLWGSVDLFAGFGATLTEDDLEALQQVGDPYAEATANQWHPSANWGLAYQLVVRAGSRAAVGGRLRWDHFEYVETVSSTTLERKRWGYLGLEGVVWL